ncbi:MAG TPA: hypothetical protein VMH23_05550, partial [Bacteroidota bacterium]|nr:hypothetical protein [Bacteroidota bacterium]
MSQIAPYFWLLPTFLYAETHYRFPYFFSFLRKPEPEVIADLPHRLEPGHTLPVLVLVKDAHLFPASLRQIRISLRQDDIEIRTLEALKEPLSFSEKLAWHLISVDTAGIHGWLEIDVEFELECRGTLRRYHNDNHRTSSHSPLRVYVSNDPLPCYAGLFLGDPHTHSDLTEDQVEFGIPIRPAIALASAMGLSYFCVTDHSYDLDDSEESYLRNDPSLPKWNHLQHAVDEANRSSAGFVVIRGEEVSCTNSIGETVHLLLYGLKKFFHGSGDGAERVGHTQCEHSVVDVLSHREDDVPSFAAHALEPVPFLQRLILHRGSWHLDDLLEEGLTGLQIINGKLDEGFHEGYRTWISLLLRGKRAIALAGD